MYTSGDVFVSKGSWGIARSAVLNKKISNGVLIIPVLMYMHVFMYMNMSKCIYHKRKLI
jgi:hypothetical protein